MLGAPVAPPSKLFGADLETVLEREAAAMMAATGLPTPPSAPQVPILVKRCVEEVERRGLDIIGIYRLCGADSKKRMLRMAFEDAPEIVDLSSANVPDINVVTGTYIHHFNILTFTILISTNIFCYRSFVEGVSPRVAAAPRVQLSLPDVGRRHGSVSSRRPGRKCKTCILHSGLSSQGQSS